VSEHCVPKKRWLKRLHWYRKLLLEESERLLVLLGAEARGAVGEGDVQLGGALHDGLALEGGHVVRHLAAEGAVVHQQHLEVGNVGHHELLEAVGQGVAGLLVGPVADVGHGGAALELAAVAGVDTLGATPALGHGHLAVALATLELVQLLLDDLVLHERDRHGDC